MGPTTSLQFYNLFSDIIVLKTRRIRSIFNGKGSGTGGFVVEILLLSWLSPQWKSAYLSAHFGEMWGYTVHFVHCY